MAERYHPAHRPAAGHELRDLSPGNIALFGAALAAIIGVALLATYALFHFYLVGVTRSQPSPSPLSYGRGPTPEPRLGVKAGDELAAMRKQESEILNTYGWVDRDRGVVRIPIERAIEMIARRGLPARTDRNGGAAAEQEPGRRMEAKKR